MEENRFRIRQWLLFRNAVADYCSISGEMLSKDNLKTAAPFMSACIVVTQLVIAVSAASVGRLAGERGRMPFLLIGFGALPIGGVLYALLHSAGTLVAVQILDGVANCIFGVVSILVVADRARGTGHFNLAAGSLATMVGIGAALSNTIGGILIRELGIVRHFSDCRRSLRLLLLLCASQFQRHEKRFGVPKVGCPAE